MIRAMKVLLRRSIVLLSLTVISAHGQSKAKNELGLLLGATRTPSLRIVGNGGSIEVGTGITFQLTYARQLQVSDSLAWYLEFPAAAIPLQDVSSPNGATPLNYDSFFVAPSLRLKFRPRGSIAPWLSAGGGYALFDESATRRDGTHNLRRGTSTGTLQPWRRDRPSHADQGPLSDQREGRGTRFLFGQTSLQREYQRCNSGQSCVFGWIGDEFLSGSRVTKNKLSWHLGRARGSFAIP
jgi:hypothetical protein